MGLHLGSILIGHLQGVRDQNEDQRMGATQRIPDLVPKGDQTAITPSKKTPRWGLFIALLLVLAGAGLNILSCTLGLLSIGQFFFLVHEDNLHYLSRKFKTRSDSRWGVWG